MDSLHIIALVPLITGGVCSLMILIDILSGNRQKMMVMNFVYPITGLYGGIFALIFYFIIGRKSVAKRYRVEERFFNILVGGKIQRPGTFIFRFRYSMMAEIPLFKLSKSDIDKKFLLSIGDEIFLNAGKEIGI